MAVRLHSKKIHRLILWGLQTPWQQANWDVRMLRQPVCGDEAPQQKGIGVYSILSSVLLVCAHGFTGDLARLTQNCEPFFELAAVHLHFVLLHQGNLLLCIVASTIV